MSPILKDRLSILETIELGSGEHAEGEGYCILEAVSYIAGEPWSDHPKCACPVISSFLRTWNDNLPDADRTRLLAPLIPKLVETKSTAEVELARGMLCIDWFLREWLPTWLDLTPALTSHATALRDCPPDPIMGFVRPHIADR